MVDSTRVVNHNMNEEQKVEKPKLKQKQAIRLRGRRLSSLDSNGKLNARDIIRDKRLVRIRDLLIHIHVLDAVRKVTRK